MEHTSCPSAVTPRWTTFSSTNGSAITSENCLQHPCEQTGWCFYTAKRWLVESRWVTMGPSHSLAERGICIAYRALPIIAALSLTALVPHLIVETALSPNAYRLFRTRCTRIVIPRTQGAIGRKPRRMYRVAPPAVLAVALRIVVAVAAHQPLRHFYITQHHSRHIRS
eukprot:SAG11_NODE_4022_length_2101_cov_10.548452_1_plen_168_part_00